MSVNIYVIYAIYTHRAGGENATLYSQTTPRSRPSRRHSFSAARLRSDGAELSPFPPVPVSPARRRYGRAETCQPQPPVSTAQSAVLWLREITVRRAEAGRCLSTGRTNRRQMRSRNLLLSTRSSNGRQIPGVVRLCAAPAAAAVPPRQAARPGQAPQGGCCPIPNPVPKESESAAT